MSSLVVCIDFEINKEEIIENLCLQRNMKNNTCNGQCYLSKQLQKAAEKDKKESNLLKEKLEIVYTITEMVFKPAVTFSILKNKVNTTYNFIFKNAYTSSVLKPPIDLITI